MNAPSSPALPDPASELDRCRAELVRLRREYRALLLKHEATFERSVVGMALVDLEGHWLEVNDALCRMVGYAREELLTLRFQDITHPDDLAEDLALVASLLRGEIDNYFLEKRYIRKDRTLVWIRLSVTLARDASGEPRHFVSVIENIDHQKRAEQALAASEARFRTAFDHMPDVVVIYDRQLRIQYINPATVKTTGMPTSTGARATEVSARSPSSSVFSTAKSASSGAAATIAPRSRGHAQGTAISVASARRGARGRRAGDG